ncbi:MAG: YetF domain-containing protein [Luteimonas sp.]
MTGLTDSLFSLGMPWWEFVLRAVAVYVVVLVLMRITGKRTVGQFTPFDLLVVVLLGTAVQNSLIGEDTSLLGGLILAATLLSLNWLVGRLSARSRRFDRFVEGAPVILARDGHLYRGQLERQSVSERDFAIARRSAGYGTLAEIELAVLETSGKITFIGKRDRGA